MYADSPSLPCRRNAGRAGDLRSPPAPPAAPGFPRARRVVRAMIAVMEQADVPPRADGLKKANQCARTLRKLEAIQQLVVGAAGMATHHVAHVQLRHLVVRHDRSTRWPLARSCGQHGIASPTCPARDAKATKICAVRPDSDAVVELGDVATTQRVEKSRKLPGSSGISDRQQRFARQRRYPRASGSGQPDRSSCSLPLLMHDALVLPTLARDVFLHSATASAPAARRWSACLRTS